MAPEVGGHRETKINRLSDENMLPSSVLKARIRTVGYDLRSTSEDTPINFEAAATDLNKNINQEASDGSLRPIILISHAYRGVIIEKALTQESVSNSLKKPIFSAIAGLIFFATPLKDRTPLLSQRRSHLASSHLQKSFRILPLDHGNCKEFMTISTKMFFKKELLDMLVSKMRKRRRGRKRRGE